MQQWFAGRTRRLARAPRVVIREPESSWWATQDEACDADERPSESSVTVAMVGQSDAGHDPEQVVTRLAELAVDDELLVVYVSEPPSRPGHHAVLDGLRGRLPRHDVIELHMGRPDQAVRRTAAVALERYLADGSLPVVVTAASAARDLTAEISSYLRADRVLRVSRTPEGAELHQVWRREPVPSIN
jgi:hypothetical protein